MIRKATLADWKAIYALDKKWFDENISYGVVKPLEREIKKDIRKNVLFVYEKENSIIGYIEGEIVKANKIKPSAGIKKWERYGILKALYIDVKFRGHKYGDLLIEQLLNYFKKNRIKKVILKSVSKDVFGLVNYYKKLGFEERVVDMVKELK